MVVSGFLYGVKSFQWSNSILLVVLVDDDIAGWLVSLCTCELGQPGGGREFSVLVTTSL